MHTPRHFACHQWHASLLHAPATAACLNILYGLYTIIQLIMNLLRAPLVGASSISDPTPSCPSALAPDAFCMCGCDDLHLEIDRIDRRQSLYAP